MTTATLPRRLIRPVGAPARRSVLIGFGATLIIGLLLLAGLSVGLGTVAGSTVLRGVSVGGVEVGGLDRVTAAERLGRDLPSLSAGRAVISVDGREEVVAFADLGRGYEIDAMLDAAFAVGRGGNPVTEGVGRLRSLVHRTALPVIVRPYDPEALAAVSAELAGRVTHPPVEAAVIRDGLTFNVRPSATGSVLQASAVQQAIAAAVDSTSPADVRIRLTAASVPPVVDSATAERAAAQAEGMVADLALTLPGSDEEVVSTLAAETIAGWISFGPQGEQLYAARIDAGPIAAEVAALADAVNQDPVNARIGVAAGGGLGGVIAGQEGRELNVEASVAAVLDGLSKRAGGGGVASMGLVVDVTEPGFTTAEAQAALPRMQRISTWTTHYVPGEANGFGNNINIPARDIDGRNLAPGEWFSFWGSIGPVTADRGFQYGGVIIGGRSVANGAIGGGICSTSTTIFNAALRAGLQMGERLNHYYYIDRYPDGLDATVYMADGYVQDMTFRNDTEHPIVVRGFGGNGFVTFELWSIPTGRTVVITDPVTSNHRAASETTQVDSSLAPGTRKRLEYPHDGHDVSRTRFVYDANGNEIHRNTYFSSYRPVNGVTLVGPTAASATAPEPPADAPPADGQGEVPPEAPPADGQGEVPPEAPPEDAP